MFPIGEGGARLPNELWCIRTNANIGLVVHLIIIMWYSYCFSSAKLLDSLEQRFVSTNLLN